MSRPLNTGDIQKIHELVELLSPAMSHSIAIDDSEGLAKPKKLSLTNLAKLFVPYNNAVNNLDLGSHDITALRGFFESIHLSTTPATIPTDIGAMYWDEDAQTYSVVLPNGVTMPLGEESYVIVARDSAAVNPIVNGTPVYTIGESGQRPRVGVARADDITKIKVTGIATHDISNVGRITTFGPVRSVPLSVKPAGETWVAGEYLWLAPTGGMTNVEPSAPVPNVRLGLILNVTGTASFDMLVYIRPAIGMYGLYDVNGDAPDNHSVLEYDSVVGYFKKTNEPVFIKVTVGELISAFQKLATHTIPGSDDDILRVQNQQVGKPHSILEIRSPDTATTEATLSLHNVASGTNDWVFDLSMHNYSGVMKLVSVLSHFTGTDAGSWEWWSRYTTGTDYDMIERQLMKLDGQTGYLGVGESLSPAARLHVKQSGWVDKPAMMIVMDSSHDSYPEGLYVKNDTNFASGGNLIRFKLVNVTDSATLLKLENAGTGAYINADGKFIVDKDGNITSPTTTALDGRLDTLEGRVDTTELTLARTNQDLASVKQTLQQGNGATLDFEDVGIVPLDARATGRANPTVEGRTATNLLENGDFADGMTGWYSWITSSTGSVTNKVYSAIGTGLQAYTRITQDLTEFVKSNDMLFARAKVRVTNSLCTILRLYYYNGSSSKFFGTIESPSENVWYELEGVIDVGIITGSQYFWVEAAYADASTANGKVMQIDGNYGVSTFNLTDIYGAGNEPSEADCAKIFSYFDGTKSIQLPARVRSVGKNLIDLAGKLYETPTVLTKVTQAYKDAVLAYDIFPMQYAGDMFYGINGYRTIEYAKLSDYSYSYNSSDKYGGIGFKRKVLPSIQYAFKFESTSGVLYLTAINYYTNSGEYISLTLKGSLSGTFTTPSNCAYVIIGCFMDNGSTSRTINNPQLELGSTATPYEPYTDSTLYIADNEEVRSVPAIADEVKVVNGQLVKVGNVQRYVLQASDIDTIVTAFANIDIIRIDTGIDGIVTPTINSSGQVRFGLYSEYTGDSSGRDSTTNINKYYYALYAGIFIDLIVTKGTSLTDAKADLAGTVIYYQLATPITTPLLTSGILQAKPNGTVYYEPYYEGSHQTDTSSQITLPYEGTIDKVTGYDENLEPYEVPSTGYTLVGTTLTITGAVENEVFYVELSRSEPLAPEMEVNVLNNDQVTLDSVNGKYYKITHTTANGVPTTVATEVL